MNHRMLFPRLAPVTPRFAGGLAAVSALSLLAAGCNTGKDNFAVVNGQTITKDEYIKILERQNVSVAPGAPPQTAMRVALDTAIGNKIVLSEAAKNNAMPTAAQVDAYYKLQKELFEKQTPGKNYEEAMKEQGTTPEDIKANFQVQLAESTLYAKQLKVGEDEIRKIYEAQRGQIGLPARVQLRLILVAPNSPDFAKAQQLLAAKTSFDQVARQVNGSPALKATGGLQPQTTPINAIGDKFKAQVNASKEGDVIGPVDFQISQQQTAKAWIRIEKKFPAYTVSYDDAAPLIRQQLVQQKLSQPQNTEARNLIMGQKLNAKFEPTNTTYKTVWDSVTKSAKDAGIGAAPAAAPVAPSALGGGALGSGTAPAPK